MAALNEDDPGAVVLTDASALARTHTADAIQTLADILNDPFAENRDRIRASEAILDRGHGKAAQAVIAVPASRQQREALAKMSNEELQRIVQSARLPRLLLEAEEPVSVEPEIDPLLR